MVRSSSCQRHPTLARMATAIRKSHRPSHLPSMTTGPVYPNDKCVNRSLGDKDRNGFSVGARRRPMGSTTGRTRAQKGARKTRTKTKGSYDCGCEGDQKISWRHSRMARTASTQPPNCSRTTPAANSPHSFVSSHNSGPGSISRGSHLHQGEALPNLQLWPTCHCHLLRPRHAE